MAGGVEQHLEPDSEKARGLPRIGAALHEPSRPPGTEARLILDILHYTFLRLGEAHRFGPPHLREIVQNMAVQSFTLYKHRVTFVLIPVKTW